METNKTYERPKIESEAGQQELSGEQKKVLGNIWVEMVVDGAQVPEKLEAADRGAMKNWLYETVMADIEKFVDELGLQIDKELVERINKEADLENKSKLELEFIRVTHSQIDDIVKGFDPSPNKSTRWDSWPKRMKETKEFNCVGATLLGTYMLEKGGIESYYGNPVGHVLNVAKLSNGDWWYVDFLNGKQNIIKLNPDEITLEDIPVLKVDQPTVDYKLIPLFDISEAPGTVLGNLAALQYEANDSSVPDENIEKKEAQAYLKKYGQNFKKADFSRLHSVLYDNLFKVADTEEMQKERERLTGARDFEKPFREYSKTLSNEQLTTLTNELRAKKEEIVDLFYQDDETVLHEVSPELKKALSLLLDGLKDVKDKQPEVYQEAVDKIVGKIKNL